MLQSTFGSRKASTVVIEFAFVLAALLFVAKHPGVFVVPLVFALVTIPFLALAALSSSKWSAGCVTLIVLAAALTELWAYFLFQLAFKAQYGHSLAFFPT